MPLLHGGTRRTNTLVVDAGDLPSTSFTLRSADQRHPLSQEPRVNRTSLLEPPHAAASTTKG